MPKNFTNSIRYIFASAEKRLEMKTKELAVQTTHHFDNLQKLIKLSEYAVADYQKVFNDREEFLRNNSKAQVDQNVSRNEDNKRAKYILWVVVSIASVLSVKGLRFFLGEFYGTVNMLLVLPLAFFLAYFIVHGSIYINNFSSQYKNTNSNIYFLIKAFAYSMVLFIPAMNLFEGFYSNYRPGVMALNIVGCVIDVILHTALVSMSSVFTTAEDSKKAIKIMRLKDKALAAEDQKLRVFNESFIIANTAFTRSAKQFVSSVRELQILNPVAAANTLFLLDNFLIWMINNKVMIHEIIQYHVGPDGQPVVSRFFFTPEQDSIRRGWDMLSTVRVDNTKNQQTEILNGQRHVTELLAGYEAPQGIQEKTPDEANPTQETKSDPAQTPSSNYPAIPGSGNPNDKVL